MKPFLRNQLEPELAAALEVTESALVRSFCPHSGLRVAAGLFLRGGRVVTGVNYECDSYGLTLCAERSAVARAQSEGSITEVRALVLAAHWREADRPAQILTPCGACRQWLAELSVRLKRDLPIFSFYLHEEKGLKTSARELLPGAFLMETNPAN